MNTDTMIWTVLEWVCLSAVHITIVTGVALLVCCCLSRRAALRHLVLLAGLIGAMLIPPAVVISELCDFKLVEYSLTDGIRSMLDDASGAAAASDLMEPALGSVPRSSSFDLSALQSALDSARGEFAEVQRAERASAQRKVASAVGFGVLWALCSFGLLLRLVASWRATRRLVRGASEMDASMRGVVARAQRIARLREMPTLLQSAEVHSPLAIGITRPAILFPSGLERSMSDQELTAILVHEMAHLARRDLWVVLLQRVATVFLWPHPLLALLNRQLSRAREELCDNAALKTCDRVDYSRLLLRVHELVGAVDSSHIATGLLLSKWNLETRIEGILDHRRIMMVHTRPLCAALVAAAFGSAICALPAMTVASPAVAGMTETPPSATSDIEARIARLEALVAELVHAESGVTYTPAGEVVDTFMELPVVVDLTVPEPHPLATAPQLPSGVPASRDLLSGEVVGEVLLAPGVPAAGDPLIATGVAVPGIRVHDRLFAAHPFVAQDCDACHLAAPAAVELMPGVPVGSAPSPLARPSAGVAAAPTLLPSGVPVPAMRPAPPVADLLAPSRTSPGRPAPARTAPAVRDSLYPQGAAASPSTRSTFPEATTLVPTHRASRDELEQRIAQLERMLQQLLNERGR